MTFSPLFWGERIEEDTAGAMTCTGEERGSVDAGQEGKEQTVKCL